MVSRGGNGSAAGVNAQTVVRLVLSQDSRRPTSRPTRTTRAMPRVAGRLSRRTAVTVVRVNLSQTPASRRLARRLRVTYRPAAAAAVLRRCCGRVAALLRLSSGPPFQPTAATISNTCTRRRPAAVRTRRGVCVCARARARTCACVTGDRRPAGSPACSGRAKPALRHALVTSRDSRSRPVTADQISRQKVTSRDSSSRPEIKDHVPAMASCRAPSTPPSPG